MSLQTVRLVLASASPARLATLQRAGLQPDVVVSGIEEDSVHADTVAGLVLELSRRKAEAVADALIPTPHPCLVVGCDSLLELDGQPYGKPRDGAEAAQRWRRMRGKTGVLHTGHTVILRANSTTASRTGVAATLVHFAQLSDAEIEEYVATGEPLAVAGAFTIDGLGGPFVTAIEGDPHSVVGISLPLLRTMFAELGVSWTRLWR